MSTPSSVAQKAGATLVDALASALLASPALAWHVEAWRVTTLGTMTVLNARGSVGCWAMGTRFTRQSGRYQALYALGFATALYWVVVPGDLLALNLSAQAVWLWRTGNTLHGWLAGVETVRA